MKKIAILSALLFFIAPQFANAGAKVDFITLDFLHSLRIPNHHVSVEIRNQGGELLVHTISNTRGKDSIFNHTKIDTLFSISFEPFLKTVVLIEILDTVAVQQNIEVDGLDGNACTVSFGNAEKSTSYSIWSPDFDTDDRNLRTYLNLCYQILMVGGLEPDEIF